jgi:DNA-binding CsgD family transcriptional regulator
VAMDLHESGRLGERSGFDPAALSEREREVFELALTGISAREIADRLTLTEATIRSHLARIYAKLGVGGRLELLARFHGQPPDPGSPAVSPFVATAPPRGRRVWPVAALAVTVVALSAGALFLWLRPDLPPATNLATVSQLVAQGRATSLDLRGDTLFVVTSDGSRYRVEGTNPGSVQELLTQAMSSSDTTVQVSISSGSNESLAVSIIVFFSATLPLAILLLVAVVTFRWLRRPPRLRPAA